MCSQQMDADPVATQLDLIVEKNWLNEREIRFLAQKSALGSVVGLGRLATLGGT